MAQPRRLFGTDRVLSDDFSLVLLHLGFVESERGHNKSGSWFRFTEAAFDVFRRIGGPSHDVIRRAIGRVLYQQLQEGFPEDFDEKKLAKSLGTEPKQVRAQVFVLLSAKLIRQLGYRGQRTSARCG